LMRGTIQVFWAPNSAAPTTDVTNMVYNTICDLESNHTCRFSVGYTSHEPMLRNTILTALDTTNAYDATANNGHIMFKVINPLTSMNGAATIKVSIFAWADEDMRFALPRSYIPSTADPIPTYSTAFPVGFYYQSGALSKTLGTSKSTTDSVVLVPSAPVLNVANVLSGEEIISVRPLLQKFSRYFYNSVTYMPTVIADGGAIYVDHFGGARIQEVERPATVFPYDNNCFQAFNWLRHYAFMYSAISGSTRYKAFMGTSTTATESTNLTMFTPTPYKGPITTSFFDTPVPLLSDFSIFEVVDNGTASEFTIPYYHNKFNVSTRHLLVNSNIATINTNSNGARVDRLIPRNMTSYNALPFTDFHLFTAGGPDTKFNTFRRVPGIQVASGIGATLVGWTTS